MTMMELAEDLAKDVAEPPEYSIWPKCPIEKAQMKQRMKMFDRMKYGIFEYFSTRGQNQEIIETLNKNLPKLNEFCKNFLTNDPSEMTDFKMLDIYCFPFLEKLVMLEP